MTCQMFRVLPFATALLLAACSHIASQEAKPPKQCTNAGPCAIEIVVDANNCNNSTVNFPEVHFPQRVNGKPNERILVEWTILQKDAYGFCPQSIVGDGVYLKGSDTYNQFEFKGFGNGSGNAPCNRKTVKLEAQNTVSGQKYEYKIQFHTQDGTKSCLIDPVMFND
ncbi:MAG: hypothetical protein ABI777_11765 [Betaproteobacteria bacterium]